MANMIDANEMQNMEDMFEELCLQRSIHGSKADESLEMHVVFSKDEYDWFQRVAADPAMTVKVDEAFDDLMDRTYPAPKLNELMRRDSPFA